MAYALDKVPVMDGNILTLLKIPGCSILYLLILCCGLSLSFLDPTFNPFIKEKVSDL